MSTRPQISTRSAASCWRRDACLLAVALSFALCGCPAPPPGPGPDPGPAPQPAPIPVPGFRVLILDETTERGNLSEEQISILTSTEVRAYLNEKCVKGPQGAPEYRVWDKDVDAHFEATHWQQALQLPRESLPWIFISDGTRGYSGPLPKTIPETIELLRRFGG